MVFKLYSDYQPTGDQPQAIDALSSGIQNGTEHQVLLGVTGSGKTFTVANMIESVNRPTLVLSHNKTLAAQLYGEFRAFFPDNAVEYFVSYYDYYQPEAYLPVTNTYIEKDLSINDEIEKLRLSTTSALLSGRRDVIVVASVSCLYGIGNPKDFEANTIVLTRGDEPGRDIFLRQLVDSLYVRNEVAFDRGTFRVNGDTVDVFPAYGDLALRIVFWGDEVEEMLVVDPVSMKTIEEVESYTIFPATIFVTTKQGVQRAVRQIQDDMLEQVADMKDKGKHLEAKRLEERVTYDLEMIKELGYCSGIENYSRYFDGRSPGERPFCLLDYFPDDYVTIIDESHVTISQVRAMYGGDRSRKETLVDYGFRLQAAKDNRPLTFDEFEKEIGQVVYVSATPADYELEKTGGEIIEQVIRPTGLLDPLIYVRPSRNQIDDLLAEIRNRSSRNERTLVTTLTKRMAEELNSYLLKQKVKARYIHSDVDTIERVEILENLRKGLFDVLVGVNLLREGLDLPEVSLVAILDADKEGFLRSERSLVQTAGRAARNVNGEVVMYADKITHSMQKTIDQTNQRREKQLLYNQEHGLTPKPIAKVFRGLIYDRNPAVSGTGERNEQNQKMIADPVVRYMGKKELQKMIKETKRRMTQAAKELDFIKAATFRDELYEWEKLLQEKE